MSDKSDTPESDAADTFNWSVHGQMQVDLVRKDFARRLERERDAARACLQEACEKLEAAIKRYRERPITLGEDLGMMATLQRWRAAAGVEAK